MATQTPFGLLLAGQPLITTPAYQPNATSFLYTMAPNQAKPFTHLAVFMLPGITLPENTAAAIYLGGNPSAFATADPGSLAANLKFLGGIGPGKESAVFKLNTSSTKTEGMVIGINVEDATSVAERIQQTQQEQQSSTALVPSSTAGGDQVLLLAQRIIQNAFNFLSSFSGQVGGDGGGGGGVEVVPLKAFQEWWRKFENKIKMDPGFLERGQD